LDAVCVGADGEVKRIETRWVGKDLARVKESESCEGVVEHGGRVGVRACVYMRVRLSGTGLVESDNGRPRKEDWTL
jgi:hypothetical protein